ncbi:LytTR family DNA-binding domain-containing protein [Paenibacillus sp. S150]|uniref:LytR/AlgR family response regulator transcription factor n=1 Tax=Paenibacillus sp. S150 TaxID=2749826 RepID=UPI001C5A1986|nr:response regulator [Paenibacillus sp. S150]MBW4085799.1 response regulator [Paenibacillus sp. S150]
MKIILVDDKPHVRNELKLLLEQLPYEYEAVLEAGCDSGAIRLIERHEPDIIVTDAKLLLSEADALDQVNRQQPHGRIIVTSSHEFVLNAFGKGGMDALLKPFAKEALEYALLRAVRAIGQDCMYGEHQPGAIPAG